MTDNASERILRGSLGFEIARFGAPLEVFHLGPHGLFLCVAATNVAFGAANANAQCSGIWLREKAVSRA